MLLQVVPVFDGMVELGETLEAADMVWAALTALGVSLLVGYRRIKGWFRRCISRIQNILSTHWGKIFWVVYPVFAGAVIWMAIAALIAAFIIGPPPGKQKVKGRKHLDRPQIQRTQ